jgi:hypothetical protein
MSHSAPSDSSTIDQTFLVGTDLVEFDRRDLPIYQSAEARWDCFDEAPYGAPLDRLFGEPGQVHIDGLVHAGPQDIAALVHDPLVGLASLSDGVMLPEIEASALDGAAQTQPAITAIFDFGGDAHTVVHLHDGWTWEDWIFDAHT